jgi:hypothetical protein
MALAVVGASVLFALVAGVGSAYAQSTVVGPGESIQKAIDAAHLCDTIVVRGVHREDVVIRKDGIKLRGIDNATLEPPARADSPCSRVFGSEGICVLGEVDLKAQKLTGSRVSDVSVSGLTIRGFKDTGIDVVGAHDATVT